MKAALHTIKNHIENIELMIEAHAWGKPIEECFKEMERSIGIIRTQIVFLDKEEAA